MFLGDRKINNKDMWAKGRGRLVHHVGEKHGNARLNEQAVLAIRFSRAAEIPLWKIGAAYGVGQGVISGITTGRTWVHVGGPSSYRARFGAGVKLTREKVVEIRRRAASGEKGRAIAASLAISESLVAKVKCRETWTWV